VFYTSGSIKLLSTYNSQENYSRENPVMLKISFREFGMSFKNAIIIASDIGDLIYKSRYSVNPIIAKRSDLGSRRL